MSKNMISPSDAGLLLHRFVTEKIPVLAWFVTADNSGRVKILGFVSSFTREVGLVVATSLDTDPGTSLSAFMTFPNDLVAASEFRYSDETTVPEDLEFGSGLRIDFPNGDTLTIMEKREKN